MQVQSINSYMSVKSNLNSKKIESTNSNPSFHSLCLSGFGEKVLYASESELRSYAERFRLIPEENLPSFLRVSNMYGFKKDTKTKLAIEKFKKAVLEVKLEIAELKLKGTDAAKKRIEELEKEAKAGHDEYWNPRNHVEPDYNGNNGAEYYF